MIDGKTYGMTLEDFFDLLEQEHCWNDLIVRVAYKYSHEKEYTITNEILTHDYPTDTYIWENDWDEGQQDVYILGFVKVEDIDIPGFKSGVMVYKVVNDPRAEKLNNLSSIRHAIEEYDMFKG